MNVSDLSQLTGKVYIILAHGLGDSRLHAKPSRKLAERVYRASWIDTKADGATYDVGATIRRIAPRLSEQQGIDLVLECHRALRAGTGTILNMQEVPQGLRKYVG